MLSATDLSFMRAQQTLALPDTCTISRKTATSDGTGGYTESWATVGSSVACRLAVARTNERIQADRIVHEGGFVITLPYGTDVTPKDRIVVGARTFEVTGYASGSWQTAMQVNCAEVI